MFWGLQTNSLELEVRKLGCNLAFNYKYTRLPGFLHIPSIYMHSNAVYLASEGLKHVYEIHLVIFGL